MDEERERGRINGLNIRRNATAEWARSLIKPLADARRALPVWADTGKPSRRAIANWLNTSGPPIPSRNGGVWSSETIGRLFDIHIGLIDEAEQAFDIEIAIIRFKWRYATDEGRKELTRQELEVRAERADKINAALRLSADLKGDHYSGKEIPDRLGRVSNKKDKLYKEPIAEVIEYQLSLFD